MLVMIIKLIQKNSKKKKMKNNNLSVKNLGELFVLNERNEQVKLSSLWKEKTAVLVFVRHFG